MSLDETLPYEDDEDDEESAREDNVRSRPRRVRRQPIPSTSSGRVASQNESDSSTPGDEDGDDYNLAGLFGGAPVTTRHGRKVVPPAKLRGCIA